MGNRINNNSSADVDLESSCLWMGVTIEDLVREFRSQAWGGRLALREFERVLTALGLDAQAVGRGLFSAFDRDKSGYVDFKELFLGLSLLLSPSNENRLECAFQMMDANNSGRVSLSEVTGFIRVVAPIDTSSHDIQTLSSRIMREADKDRDGCISFREFMKWPGHRVVLNWIDLHYERVLLQVKLFENSQGVPIHSRDSYETTRSHYSGADVSSSGQGHTVLNASGYDSGATDGLGRGPKGTEGLGRGHPRDVPSVAIPQWKHGETLQRATQQG